MSCREELGTGTVESPIVIDECAGEDVLGPSCLVKLERTDGTQFSLTPAKSPVKVVPGNQFGYVWSQCMVHAFS